MFPSRFNNEFMANLVSSETSPAVYWLLASNAEGVDLIPRGGTKIPHDVQHSQKKKKSCFIYVIT